MPRSNRPRRPRGRDVEPDEETTLDRLMSSWKRTEVRHGREYQVQPISAASAQKEYICPGCGGTVLPGTAHVVVWRADGVLGDAADLASRRHWHNHCWSIA
ncbi:MULTISPECIES: hypothetical protein [Curtobacterium]|uniref:hypothetical protein n=1 Tax=Curtobacterium TaxID=2034 RepID=UPI000DAA4207|nr:MULTISPECIES: hypothetical protein [Curtobacterium]NQX24254.1 hypothetical protein [Curtobacterium sp. VKM Ac-2852]MBO9041276.1 hypothetical protein [Curtobacterium flaccumfaciens pv. flaccumfaciens]MBO9051532.1 hypothetical protein [Curtobacterium flaccumfaciens pv. flaccumfaciens]MBT1631631.1 hypothetical protein [Curtobacterium flaccumfaciens pv. oortii]MCE0458679.1 hypothetical protein [Curtobacterium allii]